MKFVTKLKFKFPNLPLAFHPRTCLESLKLIECFFFFTYCSQRKEMSFFGCVYRLRLTRKRIYHTVKFRILSVTSFPRILTVSSFKGFDVCV